MHTAEKKIYTFNTVVTGRCNTACSYCHFYATRERKSVAYDISDELFEIYMNFIKRWSERVEGITSYRFSGGDPMVLGDRLFSLSNTAYQTTGIKPFMLTAGKRLSRKWVTAAQEASIGHVFVSIENPISPDPTAPDPNKVISAIKNFSSEKMPIVPGVCVVPRNVYKHLPEICDWFYEHIGLIPLICEVNYAPYESPSDEELDDLSKAIEVILAKYFDKTPLNLFSSVVPEYAYGGFDPYLSDLSLDNHHGLTLDKIDEKIDEMLAHIESVNYPRLVCNNKSCDWQEFCTNTKWYWQGDGRNEPEVKLRDYCRHKKAISGAFYRTLIDSSYTDNTGLISPNRSIWTPRAIS